jgi:hypothetical protein
MKTCEFFSLKTSTIKSAEVNSSKQMSNVKIIEIPKCLHAPSASPPEGSIFIGSGSVCKLGCAGNLDKCEIPEKKRTKKLQNAIQEHKANKKLPDSG